MVAMNIKTLSAHRAQINPQLSISSCACSYDTICSNIDFSIKRAPYHNPEIIVMDEATAALDNNTEREFMSALESMSKQKTMIMIAHRLSTVKNCDRLYFMKNGVVVDEGNFSSLLSRSREFQAMAQ
jgi:ABC-type multidrug transport system fused ATPase/permease subunit